MGRTNLTPSGSLRSKPIHALIYMPAVTSFTNDGKFEARPVIEKNMLIRSWKLGHAEMPKTTLFPTFNTKNTLADHF